MKPPAWTPSVLLLLPDNTWTRANFARAFQQYGCTVYEFYYSANMSLIASSEWRHRRNEDNLRLQRFLEIITGEIHLDLCFTVVYDDWLLPQTAKCLRARCTVLVNYHVDMLAQWYRVIGIAPKFDVIAVAQKANVEMLSKYNSHLLYLPMAAHPENYNTRDVELEPELHDKVVFVGSPMAFRGHVLRLVAAAGLPLVIFGYGWDQDLTTTKGKLDHLNQIIGGLYKASNDLRKYAYVRWRAEGATVFLRSLQRRTANPSSYQVPGAEVRGVISPARLPLSLASAGVCLGFTEVGWIPGDRHIRVQMRARDFEAPMSGACYLVQEAPEHAELYRVGEEIDTWVSIDELVEKTGWYLSHADQARQLGHAGQMRALAEHTWFNRLNKLFLYLGGSFADHARQHSSENFIA